MDRERSGSVVDYLTRDRGVVRSNLTGVTPLCHWARQSLLSTGSTQEDPSRHNWKIIDWDVKNQTKQTTGKWLVHSKHKQISEWYHFKVVRIYVFK